MKLHHIIISLFLLAYTSHAQTSKTSIKGAVKNWPTDSIYLRTMTFHSPNSSKLYAQKVSNKNTYNFELENTDNAFVIQIFPTRESANFNKENLLYSNLTDKYYYRQCIKFYTYGKSTILVDPNKTMEIDLTYNSTFKVLDAKRAEKYREKGIKVPKNNKIESVQKLQVETNKAFTLKNEYFQKSIDFDKVIEKHLSIRKNKPLKEVILAYHKISQQQKDDLENNKDKISNAYYNYLKTEIEFGAKHQFLRFLMLEDQAKANAFFSKEIPKEVLDIVQFDKTKVDTPSMLSEEFNKFMEMYLNFTLSCKNKKLILYSNFNRQKIKTAIRTLPNAYVYYYLANNLLQTSREKLIEVIKNKEAVEELITKTITKYPNGELNDKLIIHYDL